jgi:nucleotide-binding universal stress UspA family protein
MNQANDLPRIIYRRILYATDLSESGRHAFPHAAGLAHTHNAALTVYHVVETHDFEKFLVGYISEAVWEDLRGQSLADARETLLRRRRRDAAIRDDVDELCQQALAEHDQPYVTYDVAIDIGDPVERIVAKAHEGDYDLVVISKHGHGRLKGGLMGDTAQRVLRRCQKPVLVVPVPAKDAG